MVSWLELQGGRALAVVIDDTKKITKPNAKKEVYFIWLVDHVEGRKSNFINWKTRCPVD
tara:strand:- start:184 stop:360 length:177 start_codon:yes stop_codon:yes gene_type:complete